jgi:hypothetical protein
MYGYGTYVKDIVAPHGFYLHGINLHEIQQMIPMLKLDNGTICYGCYCWFSSEESVKKFEEMFEKSFYLDFNEELEKAKVQLTETTQKLKLQFQQAKSEYEYCIQKYSIAQANLKLAERIENKQEIKFKEGLSTSFDFADAQKQLYTAQQESLQAMLDVINKRAALEKLIN